MAYVFGGNQWGWGYLGLDNVSFVWDLCMNISKIFKLHTAPVINNLEGKICRENRVSDLLALNLNGRLCRTKVEPPAKFMTRHQMETFFRFTGPCERNSPLTGELPAQRPVTRSFDVFYDLRLNKRLSKQSWKAGDVRRHHAHYNVTVMLQNDIIARTPNLVISRFNNIWRVCVCCLVNKCPAHWPHRGAHCS